MSKNSTVFSKNQTNNEKLTNEDSTSQSINRLLDLVSQNINRSIQNKSIDSRLNTVIEKLELSFE